MLPNITDTFSTHAVKLGYARSINKTLNDDLSELSLVSPLSLKGISHKFVSFILHSLLARVISIAATKMIICTLHYDSTIILLLSWFLHKGESLNPLKSWILLTDTQITSFFAIGEN